jgi:SAM-dependent methyltransferase
MDISEYAIQVFNGHVAKTGMATWQLQDKIILELGPGDSVATAIIAAAHGARAILVDAGDFVCKDIAPYLKLACALTNQGLHLPEMTGCKNIHDILRLCDAHYMTNGLTSLETIESQSVDLIFSQAVLEHIRKMEFRRTLQECHRILRPNGICSHQVDLRDHLGGSLNNLRFSEPVWESEIFANSGFYTNRLRYSQMLHLFSDVGFAVEVTDVRRWSVLPTSSCKLSAEFRNLPDDELCVSGFHVLLRRERIICETPKDSLLRH